MPTYGPASTEVHALVASVMEDWHPDLVKTEARIGIVMAYPTLDKDGEPTGPAVTLHGEPCLATIKANAQKDRVDGKPDATIVISAPEWNDLAAEPDGNERRVALLDHKLYHLIVRRDKETGRFDTDDQGRPLFEMRRHDWTFAGFREIASRHGKRSQEVIQAQQLHDAYGNILFGFADDLAVDRDEALDAIASVPGLNMAATVTNTSRRKPATPTPEPVLA